MNELKQLGSRIRNQRILSQLKQTELAEKASVSVDVLKAVENARPITTESLARILRGLNMPQALENLLPPITISPIELQKLKGKQRQRVR